MLRGKPSSASRQSIVASAAEGCERRQERVGGKPLGSGPNPTSGVAFRPSSHDSAYSAVDLPSQNQDYNKLMWSLLKNTTLENGMLGDPCASELA